MSTLRTGKLIPSIEGGRRHQVAQRALPDAVFQLGLDVAGERGVMEADAAAEHADQRVRRSQPGARERDERGALRVIRQQLRARRPAVSCATLLVGSMMSTWPCAPR